MQCYSHYSRRFYKVETMSNKGKQLGNKEVTKASYQNRILTVLDYVWNNLQQPLDNNLLADIAHFSPYHFHRIYREMMQETLANTIRRLRLHRAAHLLLSSTQNVSEIAKNCGYGSAEALIRAFERQHGTSPGKFRESPNSLLAAGYEQFADTLQIQKEYNAMYEVTFKQIEDIPVGAIKHTGPYINIGHAFDKLDTIAASSQQLPEALRFFGIYYEDPEGKEPEKLESHACLTASAEQANSANLESLNIQGGEYAVLRFVGPYAQLETAYQWFYGKWLPDSGKEMANKPYFEEYLNDPKDTPPGELVTDIYLPIAG